MNKKEHILNLSKGGYDFFEFVFNSNGQQLKQSEKNSGLRSPFYKDSNGSLSVFEKDGEFYFKDFGNERYQGDVFAFAGFYYNLDPKTNFKQILDNMTTDLNISLNNNESNPRTTGSGKGLYKPLPIANTSSNKPFSIEFGDDFSYWKRFSNSEHISEIAEKMGVFSINKINQNINGADITRSSSSSKPIFGFKFSNEDYKIYQPLGNNKKLKHLWLKNGNNTDFEIFGIKDLPNKGDYVLICEGLKDAFVACLNGFNAIGVDNANIRIPEELIHELQYRFDKVIICYDNDEAGKKGAKKIVEEYSLYNFIIPENLNGIFIGKDISNFFEKGFGHEDFKTLLDTKLISPQYTYSELSNKTDMCKVLTTRSFLKKRVREHLIIPQPIITRFKDGIIFPNTINVIQGKTGTHKSRLVEVLCNCLLSKNQNKINLLGFRRNISWLKHTEILFVDTERDINYQFPRAIQSLIKNSENDTKQRIDELDFLSLINISRMKRFETLKNFLELNKSNKNKHTIIVLDVITDCVGNFNNPQESMQLIDLINVMINSSNVTFICVIHENPGESSKARGHVGTELMNKATTQLQIGFEKDNSNRNTDLIKVDYIKTRNIKKPEQFYLRYSEEHKGLIEAESDFVADNLSKKRLKGDIKDIIEFLGITLSKEQKMPNKELLELLKTEFEFKDRIARERLREILENFIKIEKEPSEFYYLFKVKEGNKVYYSLTPA